MIFKGPFQPKVFHDCNGRQGCARSGCAAFGSGMANAGMILAFAAVCLLVYCRLWALVCLPYRSFSFGLPLFFYYFFLIWVCFSCVLNAPPSYQLHICFLSTVKAWWSTAILCRAGLFFSKNSVRELSLYFVISLLAWVDFFCWVITAQVQLDLKEAWWLDKNWERRRVLLLLSSLFSFQCIESTCRCVRGLIIINQSLLNLNRKFSKQKLSTCRSFYNTNKK